MRPSIHELRPATRRIETAELSLGRPKPARGRRARRGWTPWSRIVRIINRPEEIERPVLARRDLIKGPSTDRRGTLRAQKPLVVLAK